jgi:hypothetical protein
MATIFMVNEEIARGMVCFFHQKKHSYLIFSRVEFRIHLLAYTDTFETKYTM